MSLVAMESSSDGITLTFGDGYVVSISGTQIAQLKALHGDVGTTNRFFRIALRSLLGTRLDAADFDLEFNEDGTFRTLTRTQRGVQID